MDNWQACTETCRGVVSRRYPLHYAMGQGHEGFNEDLRAWASDFRISESNHRHFYQRWAQLMAAKTWADVEAAGARTNGGGQACAQRLAARESSACTARPGA